LPQKRDTKTGRFAPNGGAYIDEQGYPRISCGPCRGQRVHRVKAAIDAGRELRPTEDVHHLGEKTDLSRLQILSHGAHSSLSAYERKRLKMEDAFLRKQWEEICGAYFDAVEMGGGELDVEFP
jgi:hypothetical protein